eukprot:3081735-Rhodomonas_salina.2
MPQYWRVVLQRRPVLDIARSTVGYISTGHRVGRYALGTAYSMPHGRRQLPGKRRDASWIASAAGLFATW